MQETRVYQDSELTHAFERSTEFLFGLQKFGIKMDLDNIAALMEYAGGVHEGLNVVHVAGTNGKGSTCAMVASVLSSQGYKVGLYTSPHIESFTERFRINGAQISREDVNRLVDFFHDEIVRLRATFFEATTAMMFKYFAEQKVDFAVVETGLGGRLDATNIVDPLVSIVTGIALDHTAMLGNTLEKIAYEKAGIIKTGRPAVVNVKKSSVKHVFECAAAERGSELFFVEDVAKAVNPEMGLEFTQFDATVFGTSFDAIRVDVGGRHQISNAMSALSAINLLGRSGFVVSRSAVYDGLAEICRNTGHRGRLEVVVKDPLIILDVAHNPDGVRALLDSLGPLAGRMNPVLLFAAMKDKDAVVMLNSLRERFSRIILTQLKIGRALGANDLKKLSNDIKLDTQIFDNSTEALRAAISQTDNDSFLLITGSHYLAGEVLPVLDKSVTKLESL